MSRLRPILIVGLFLTFGETHNLSAQFAREANTVGINFPSQNFQGFIYNDSGNREYVNLNRRADTARRGDTFRGSQGRGISAQSSVPPVDPRLIAEQGLRDPFIGPPARLPPVAQRIALQQSRTREEWRYAGERERFARDPFEHRPSSRLVQRPLQDTPSENAPRMVVNPSPGSSAARRDLLPQAREARAYPFLQDRQ
ncbi:MAG: hypothetical protein U0903_18035 [Planctomycetales bacterium]